MVQTTVATFLMLLMTACNYGVIDLDVQGHRGCRGLMPENTLEGFRHAWELGVKTLELDVVVSRDHHLVVSHEAWFSHKCCLDPQGQAIPEAMEQAHVIYQMDYAEVKQWDCGNAQHPDFPKQQHFRAHKPELSEVFDAIESLAGTSTELDREPRYNIEIKVEPGGDGKFQPPAKTFVGLVLAEIQSHELDAQCTLQSFDLEALREVRRQHETIKTSLLVEEGEDYKEKIAELGFYPEVLSPDFHLVDEEMLHFANAKNMKVIPWTVNEVEDMRRLIRLGVHGLISDYPDVLIATLQKL